MIKSAAINVRTTPEIKAKVDQILKQLGLTQTEAIHLFLNQLILHKGLPFPLVIPAEPSSHNANHFMSFLDEITGTINAPEDWSSEHDHYLYGTAKKSSET